MIATMPRTDSSPQSKGSLQYMADSQKLKFDRWAFNKRFLQVKNEAFKSWYPSWKELTTFCNPTRGFYNDGVPNLGTKIDHKIVLDNHARRCVRTLASGMQSGLTSPARPWFTVEFDDPDLSQYQPVKVWCDQVERRMLDIYGKSNIYSILYMMYEELATVGTAASFIGPDFQTVLRGRSYTVGEYYLGCGPDGRVNTFARELWMTVIQLIREFGFENVTPDVQNSYRVNDTERWIRVRHMIEPNDDRVPGYRDFKNMEYRSLYWQDGSPQNMYLRLGGHSVFPVLTPRWARTTTADIYGRGPGWDALGDVKMLQKEQRDKLTALDKIGNPPTQSDSSVDGEPNTLPGGNTRYSAGLPNAGVRPLYQVNPDINAYRQDIIEVKKAISEAFFTDMFLMLFNEGTGGGTRMTAYEVAERQAEKLVLLGPLLESVENELLTPLNEITLHRMIEIGMMPPPPAEIRGREIKFNYVSVLARAQRMVNLTSVDQWVAGVQQLAATDPSATDIINTDEISLGKADMLTIPGKMIVPPQIIAAKRKQRAEQAAQQAKLQALKIGAEAAAAGGKAVKSLANSPMNEDSALQGVLAGVSGGGITGKPGV